MFNLIYSALTILYLSYDNKKVFSADIDCLDDPLQQTNFSIQSPKVFILITTRVHIKKYILMFF